ncbi:MAG: hypothetical protein MK077_05280 [Phycisphaerales bacterium]|nr:hypothetical protein [Phycisphaerales bacterium]
MRWIAFLIAAMIAVAIDSGLVGVFTIRPLASATPSLAAVLLAFVALQTRPSTARWAAWVLGIMLDLSPTAAGAVGGIPIIGPRTLGCIAAVQVILLVRPVLFRRRIVTIAVMSGVTWATIGLIAAAVETIRWWLPWTHAMAPPPASTRVLTVLASAVYTAVLGLPIGALLVGTAGLWRFEAVSPRLDYAGSRR